MCAATRRQATRRESVIDIHQIRDRLNEQTFEGGRRHAGIGRVSELFPDHNEEQVAPELEQLAAQLRSHDLTLTRGDDDPDELLAVQQLKYGTDDYAWLAEGLQWASRITTVALEMVVPAALGFWLDNHFETSFLGILGLLIGVPLGLWHLIRMTKPKREAAEARP